MNTSLTQMQIPENIKCKFALQLHIIILINYTMGWAPSFNLQFHHQQRFPYLFSRMWSMLAWASQTIAQHSRSVSIICWREENSSGKFGEEIKWKRPNVGSQASASEQLHQLANWFENNLWARKTETILSIWNRIENFAENPASDSANENPNICISNYSTKDRS